MELDKNKPKLRRPVPLEEFKLNKPAVARKYSASQFKSVETTSLQYEGTSMPLSDGDPIQDPDPRESRGRPLKQVRWAPRRQPDSRHRSPRPEQFLTKADNNKLFQEMTDLNLLTPQHPTSLFAATSTEQQRSGSDEKKLESSSTQSSAVMEEDKTERGAAAKLARFRTPFSPTLETYYSKHPLTAISTEKRSTQSDKEKPKSSEACPPDAMTPEKLLPEFIAKREMTGVKRDDADPDHGVVGNLHQNAATGVQSGQPPHKANNDTFAWMHQTNVHPPQRGPAWTSKRSRFPDERYNTSKEDSVERAAYTLSAQQQAKMHELAQTLGSFQKRLAALQEAINIYGFMKSKPDGDFDIDRARTYFDSRMSEILGYDPASETLGSEKEALDNIEALARIFCWSSCFRLPQNGLSFKLEGCINVLLTILKEKGLSGSMDVSAALGFIQDRLPIGLKHVVNRVIVKGVETVGPIIGGRDILFDAENSKTKIHEAGSIAQSDHGSSDCSELKEANRTIATLKDHNDRLSRRVKQLEMDNRMVDHLLAEASRRKGALARLDEAEKAIETGARRTSASPASQNRSSKFATLKYANKLSKPDTSSSEHTESDAEVSVEFQKKDHSVGTEKNQTVLDKYMLPRPSVTPAEKASPSALAEKEYVPASTPSPANMPMLDTALKVQASKPTSEISAADSTAAQNGDHDEDYLDSDTESLVNISTPGSSEVDGFISASEDMHGLRIAPSSVNDIINREKAADSLSTSAFTDKGKEPAVDKENPKELEQRVDGVEEGSQAEQLILHEQKRLSTGQENLVKYQKFLIKAANGNVRDERNELLSGGQEQTEPNGRIHRETRYHPSYNPPNFDQNGRLLTLEEALRAQQQRQGQLLPSSAQPKPNLQGAGNAPANAVPQMFIPSTDTRINGYVPPYAYSLSPQSSRYPMPQPMLRPSTSFYPGFGYAPAAPMSQPPYSEIPVNSYQSFQQQNKYGSTPSRNLEQYARASQQFYQAPPTSPKDMPSGCPTQLQQQPEASKAVSSEAIPAAKAQEIASLVVRELKAHNKAEDIRCEGWWRAMLNEPRTQAIIQRSHWGIKDVSEEIKDQLMLEICKKPMFGDEAWDHSRRGMWAPAIPWFKAEIERLINESSPNRVWNVADAAGATHSPYSVMRALVHKDMLYSPRRDRDWELVTIALMTGVQYMEVKLRTGEVTMKDKAILLAGILKLVKQRWFPERPSVKKAAV